MRHDELRDVLLVRGVEEADRDGTLIPPADRAAAARDARRTGSEQQSAVVTRARILLAKIVARHPFVQTVLELASGPAAIGWMLVALGALVGFGMSALEPSRRINILVPAAALSLLAWNLLVYAILAAHALRRRPANLLPAEFVNFGFNRLSRRIAGAAAFHASLAGALSRFARDWLDAARPLLLLRATRVFHVAAAAVGVGLIAGLYLRGIAFDYQAGWESTFLEALAVRELLSIAYGPASLITGIPIPDAAQLEAMRWTGGRGGARAAPWLHLLAATIALVIIVPRLLLALFATAGIARLSSSMPLPKGLADYFDNVFGAAGGWIGRGLVAVVPYAYEPPAASRAGLRAYLSRSLGDGLTIDARAPVRYGEEDEFLGGLNAAPRPDVAALLFTLASTPEAENHGAILMGLRDWAAAAQPPSKLVVIVDGAGYAARMSREGEGRVSERREAWREFVSAHGLEARVVDLAAEDRGP